MPLFHQFLCRSYIGYFFFYPNMPRLCRQSAAKRRCLRSTIGTNVLTSEGAEESLVVHRKKRRASDRRTRTNNSLNTSDGANEPTLSPPVIYRHLPRFLARHSVPDIPQEEIDYVTSMAYTELQGIYVQYIRDMLSSTHQAKK